MPLNWGLSFGVMLGRTSAASASSGRGSVGKKLTGLQGNVLADVIYMHQYLLETKKCTNVPWNGTQQRDSLLAVIQ